MASGWLGPGPARLGGGTRPMSKAAQYAPESITRSPMMTRAGAPDVCHVHRLLGNEATGGRALTRKWSAMCSWSMASADREEYLPAWLPRRWWQR